MRYGITEDTGGHITYVLGEMEALARRPEVTKAEIVTRLFDETRFDDIHAKPHEDVSPGFVITRIDSGNRAYLAKEALAADRAAFTAAFIDDLRGRDRLPDLIHAHFADAADVAAQVERALGIPFIYTAHSLAKDKLACLDEATPELRARIDEETRAIARASAIVASSRDECERQLPAYDASAIGKIHRIVPGVATISVSETARRNAENLIAPFLRDLAKPMVLAVARPVHKKNLAALVDAFGSSETLRDTCNLVILAGLRTGIDTGSAEQSEVMDDLLRAIDRHDLYGQVAYPKKHTRAQVGALYELARRSGGVFVNPALIEPYGLTLIEAASYGLPVVATKNGGPLDIVRDLEHGILVDPRDTCDIASAIEKIVGDHDLWATCSQSGLRNLAGMTWDSYAEAFVSIAQSVCSKVERPDAANMSNLVVSDIDNTLTGCTIGAGRFTGFFDRRRDFGFAVATGRSLVEAQRLVREWRLPQPLAWITSVGTELYIAKGGDLVLDADYADAISESWDASAVDAAIAGIPGLEPQAHYEQRQFKRSFFVRSPGAVRAVREQLRRSGVAARVVFSHGDLLDILPPKAGKGAAMAFLADKFGIVPANVYAAGDSGNDIDMLKACENAILVGNHADEIAGLRNRANVYVAQRNHGSGALEGVLMHRRLRKSRSLEVGAA